ncbi:MAG: hypothetical protein ABI204_06765 [Ginsengibacter sp.]
MKKLNSLIILLLFTVTSYGQFNMPSFKEVVTAFYSKYSFDSQENFLKFSWKKDGWYVSQDYYNNPGNYIKTVQFWSKGNNSFININYPESNGDTSLISENIAKYLQLIEWTYEEYQFNRNKYYGYPGWDWNIINDSADLNSGNDSLLESQGRAYSNYASGFIAEQFGDLFINNDSDRVPLKSNDKINDSRINKFIRYELKSIEAYKKIIKINPEYETKVGNIKIKCANEYMFMYTDLMMANAPLQAKQFAERADYPDSLLTISKTYLESVPLNSIIITAGDNDTYPLWYLQEIKEYRQDVIVLNYNLLGLRQFISLIGEKYNHRLFSTIDTSYLKNNFDYAVFSNDNDAIQDISATTFLKDLNKNYDPYDTTITDYKNEALRKYYSKSIFFTNEKSTKSNTVKLNNYLLMNDYMIIDMLNTNPTRNVFSTFYIDMLDNFLEQAGNLYKLDLWKK